MAGNRVRASNRVMTAANITKANAILLIGVVLLFSLGQQAQSGHLPGSHASSDIRVLRQIPNKRSYSLWLPTRLACDGFQKVLTRGARSRITRLLDGSEWA